MEESFVVVEGVPACVPDAHPIKLIVIHENVSPEELTKLLREAKSLHLVRHGVPIEFRIVSAQSITIINDTPEYN